MSSSSSNNESAFVPIDFSRYIVDVDSNDVVEYNFGLDFVYSPPEKLNTFVRSLLELDLPPGKALGHIHLIFTWNEMKLLEKIVQAMEETPVLALSIDGPVLPQDESVSEHTIQDLCLRLASIPKNCFCLGSAWAGRQSACEWVCFRSIFAGLQRCCCCHDTDFKIYCPEDGDTDALRRLLSHFDSRECRMHYSGTLKLQFGEISERSLQDISRVLQQDCLFKLDALKDMDAANEIFQPSQETLAVLEAAISQNSRIRELDFGFEVDPTITRAICRGLQKNKGIQYLCLFLNEKEQLDAVFESLPLFNLKTLFLSIDACDYTRDEDEEDDDDWSKVFSEKMREGMLQNTSLLTLDYMCLDRKTNDWNFHFQEEFGTFLKRNKLLSKIPAASSRLEPGVLAEYVAKMAGNDNAPETSASPLFRTLQTFYVPYLTNQAHDETVKSPRNKRQRVE